MSYFPDASIGATGAAPPAEATLVGGTDGADLRAIAVDSSGKQRVLLYDASGNPITSTASALDVNIKSGAASFTVIDEAAWTAGTSPFVPEGGVFNDSATALTSGQQGTGRQTPNRARHINVRKQDGTELGTVSNPFIVSLSAAMIQPVRTVTANDTATTADFCVLVDATSGNLTETLPAGLSSAQTMVLVIKKIDSSAHTVTIAGTIDGGTNFILYTQNSSLTVQWNGTSWSIEALDPGKWGSWTPAVTASGAMTVSGLAVTAAQFIRNGALAFFSVRLDFTLGGAASAIVFATLPIPAVGSDDSPIYGSVVPFGLTQQLFFGFVDYAGSQMIMELNGGGNWPLGAVTGLRVAGFYRCV